MIKICKKTIRILQLIKRWISTTYMSVMGEVIILCTPNHENLGDHAIALAEYQLLYSIKPNIKIFDINGSEFDDLVYLRNKHIPVPVFYNKRIIVLFTGGGFLGDIWKVEEYRFRKALEIFKENKFIVCPQTVYFRKTDGRNPFFEESKKIYGSHPNLKFFLREKNSYNFMIAYMPDIEAYLVPDVVTCMNPPTNRARREGILLCLRDDCERIVKSEEIKEMISTLSESFPAYSIFSSSTMYTRPVKASEREKIVYDKIKEFASVKLVITDRLHAMVFSAISSTPCIAFDNLSRKVSGVYHWIQDHPYIQVLDGMKDFKATLQSMNLEEEYKYDSMKVKKAIFPLIEELRKDIIKPV